MKTSRSITLLSLAVFGAGPACTISPEECVADCGIADASESGSDSTSSTREPGDPDGAELGEPSDASIASSGGSGSSSASDTCVDEGGQCPSSTDCFVPTQPPEELAFSSRFPGCACEDSPPMCSPMLSRWFSFHCIDGAWQRNGEGEPCYDSSVAIFDLVGRDFHRADSSDASFFFLNSDGTMSYVTLDCESIIGSVDGRWYIVASETGPIVRIVASEDTSTLMWPEQLTGDPVDHVDLTPSADTQELHVRIERSNGRPATEQVLVRGGLCATCDADQVPTGVEPCEFPWDVLVDD